VNEVLEKFTAALLQVMQVPHEANTFVENLFVNFHIPSQYYTFIILGKL